MWLSILLIASVLLCNSESQIQTSLYPNAVNIIELTTANYNNTVYNPATPYSYFVQFYKASCGHCRYFAPVFKRFAENVPAWSSTVKLVVVNCNVDLMLCKENLVRYTPLFRYVPLSATRLSETSVVSVPDPLRNTNGLREVVAQKVMEDYNATRIRTAWQTFQFVDKMAPLDRIWSTFSQDTQKLAVLFTDEQQTSTLGGQFILDVSSTPGLAVRRAHHDSAVAQSSGINRIPQVALYERSSLSPEFGPVDLTPKSASKFLKLAGDSGLTLTTLPHVTDAPITTPAMDDAQRRSMYYVSETDMLMSMRNALFNEVIAFHQVIEGEAYTALLNFTSILKDFFPVAEGVNTALASINKAEIPDLPRSQRARAMFVSLNQFLKNSRPPLSTDHWKQRFEQLEVEHSYPFPNRSNTEYQHCKGSAPRFRGFTCGLWTTFHAITVQAFLSNNNHDIINNPAKPLFAIQQWVKHFFSCVECRSHFMNMTTVQYPIARDTLRYPSQAILYLWRAHNIVNNRLSKDKVTEDPLFPKMQFPADFLCERCQSDRGRWYQYRVLNYLIDYYTNIRPHTETSNVVMRTRIHGGGTSEDFSLS